MVIYFGSRLAQAQSAQEKKAIRDQIDSRPDKHVLLGALDQQVDANKSNKQEGGAAIDVVALQKQSLPGE